MGNQSAKSVQNSPLNQEEITFVEDSFKSVSTDGKLDANTLTQAWSGELDPEFLTYTIESFFGQSEIITSKAFADHFYAITKGNLYEKSNFINTNVLGNPMGAEGGITHEKLLPYVSAVVRSYIIVLDHNRTTQYSSWINQNVLVKLTDFDNYSEFLLNNLVNTQIISLNELENWLHFNPTWLEMWKAVILYLYSTRMTHIPACAECHPKTLPLCELPPNCGELKSILDIGKIMFLNGQIPTALRSKWRLLFNSKIHGESFATFLGKIMNQGPTLLIVQDHEGYMFGGFAPHSWNLKPKFVGNESAVLFKLEPKMQSFDTSGYNDHYQYLNINQQTMPNGLGMGGQFQYWGLWIDCEYGLGQSSETCTTFKNYKQLSKSKAFHVKNMEVWGVGEVQNKDEAVGKTKSILDMHLEDQVILDLAGKGRHSEGLRDPDLGD